MASWPGQNADRRDARSSSAAALGRRLSRDRSGASAIEFAFVAAPFFGLVLLILQVGLFHFSQQSLDHATRVAARQITTGTLPAGAKTLSGFKTTVICPKVLWKMNCANLVVNAYKVPKVSNAADDTGIYKFVDEQTTRLRGPVTDPQQNTFCLGGPGDYIFLDIAYVFPDFTGGIISGTVNQFLVRSSTFIYNEPTVAGSASC